jgi:hypothetical protein
MVEDVYRSPSLVSNEYIKFHGDNIDADWERVVRLWEATRGYAEFNAPRPLRLISELQSIAYERLPEGCQLAQLLMRKRTTPASEQFLLKTLHAVGMALASFHSRSNPVNDQLLYLNPKPKFVEFAALDEYAMDVSQSASAATLHGDFGSGNVWVDASGKIWLFDPLPSKFTTDRSAGKASIYVDVAHMIASLWAGYPLSVLASIRRLPRLAWIKAFAAGYSDYYEKALSVPAAMTIAATILDSYGSHLFKTSRFPKGLLYRRLISVQQKRLLQTAMNEFARDKLQ